MEVKKEGEEEVGGGGGGGERLGNCQNSQNVMNFQQESGILDKVGP